jgi:hypothetical protein
MGGWFSKWTSPTAKAKANIVGCSKPITDPQIIKQFEDHIYGIEMTPRTKQEVIHQPIPHSGGTVL